MWNRMFGKPNERESGAPFQSSGRKGDDRSSTRRRTESRTESISSSKPAHKSSRGDDRDRGLDPTSSSYSSTMRQPFPGTATASIGSSYATALGNQINGSYTAPELVRNKSMADQVPTTNSGRDERDHNGRRTRKSERRERSSSRNKKKKNGKDRPRSRDRGEKERDRRVKGNKNDVDRAEDMGVSKAESYGVGATRAPTQSSGNFNEQVQSSGFMQFPGQYDGPTSGFVGGPSVPPTRMSDHVQDQFPGQFPTQSTAPYRPPLAVSEGGPGLAAEYYGDGGQSVAGQPGVRMHSPSLIVGAEPHLQAASSNAAPPPEPSASGAVGAAASFFSGNFDTETQGHTNYNNASGGKNNASNYQPGSSKPIATYKPASNRLNNSSHSSAPVVPTLGAAAVGAAAGYMMSNQASSHQHYQDHESSMAVGSQTEYTSNADPRPPRIHDTYDSTLPSPQVPRPSKHPSQTSNVPLYAAGAAGAAGLAAASAYQYNHHSNHNSSHLQQHQASSMAQRHHHQGPLSKFVDFFKDPDGVAQFEAYSEYIGVCKYCFAPGSSPRDAPRKHQYRRRKSNERFGSSTRIDKDNRYWSSDGENRRQNRNSWLATGITGYGLAKLGESLFNQNNGFDDTYSAQTGRHSKSHRSSQGRRNSHSPDRKSYSSHGVTRQSSDTRMRQESRSKDKIETGITSDGKVYRKDSSGGNFGGPSITTYEPRQRSRSRSRSKGRDRRNNVAEAALGAAIGTSVVVPSSRRRSRSPEKAFVRTKRRSRDQSPDPSSVPNLGIHSNVQGGNRLRQSPPSSRIDLSTSSHRNESARRSRSRKKEKTKKGFFSFGNGSSSSSDSALAFGGKIGGRRNTQPSKTKDRDHKKAEAAMLGLGAATVALALNESRQSKKDKRKGEAINLKETSHTHGRNSRLDTRSKKGPSSPNSEEDSWVSASEDEYSSADSMLAYGADLRKGRSQESLSSGSSGMGKWGWRWGSKKEKKRASKRDEPASESGVSGQPGTIIAGLAGAAAGASYVAGNRQQPTEMGSASGGSLQQVYPVATSDPSQFDVIMGPPVTSPNQPSIITRPAPIPIQHPQPRAPVPAAVYSTQTAYGHSYSEPNGQAVYQAISRPQPSIKNGQLDEHIKSHQNSIPGAFPRDGQLPGDTLSAAQDSKTRRRDTLPSVLAADNGFGSTTADFRTSTKEESSAVRFDLTKEQAEKDRRERPQQKQEEDRRDKRRQNREDEDRRERRRQEREGEDRRERRRQEREDEDRRERRERRKADEQRESFKNRRASGGKSSEVVDSESPRKESLRDQESTTTPRVVEIVPKEESWAAAPIATGVIGAAVGAAIGHETRQDRRKAKGENQGIGITSEKHQAYPQEIPESLEGVDERGRPIQEKSDSVWQAVAKVSRRSSSHEDYGTFFAPPELQSRSDSQRQVTGTDTHEDPEIITAEPRGFHNSSGSPAYSFTLDGDEADIRPIDTPSWVPKLKLIEPTPTPSRAGSINLMPSPEIQPRKEVEINAEDSPKSTTDSKVTWGKPETIEYTVITPKYELDQFVASPPSIASDDENVRTRSGNGIADEINQPSPTKQTSSHSTDPHYGDDLEFAATLAASLEDTGFDPSIVIDNPNFRRRNSPPGSEQGGFSHKPAHQLVSPHQAGHVVGEVSSSQMPGTFDDERPQIEISKEDQFQKDLTSRGKGSGEVAEKSTERNAGGSMKTYEDEYFDAAGSLGKSSESDDRALVDAENAVTDLTIDPGSDNNDSDSRAGYVSLPRIYPEGKIAKVAESSNRGDLYESPSEDAPSAPVIASIPNDIEEGKKSRRKSRHKSSSFADAASAVSSTASAAGGEANTKSRKEKKGGSIFSIFSRSTDDASEPTQSKDLFKEESTGDFDESGNQNKKTKSRKSTRHGEDAKSGVSEPVAPLKRSEEDIDENRSRKSRGGRDRRRSDGDSATKDSGRITQDLPAQVLTPASIGYTLPDKMLTDPKDGQSTHSSQESRTETREGFPAAAAKEQQIDDFKPESFLGMRQAIPPLPDVFDDPETPQPSELREKITIRGVPTILSYFPPIRKTTDFSGGNDDDPPVSPHSKPASPLSKLDTHEQRFPSMQKDDTIPTPSPTAVPLNFRRPPSSPSVARSLSSAPLSPASSITAIVPPRLKPRPRSTEFKSSDEFRPLWLPELVKSRQELPHREPYPSLPSSHTTSRSSSVHDPTELGHDQMDNQDAAGAFQSSLSMEPKLITDITHDNLKYDLLDSQQPTPTAPSFESVLGEIFHEEKEYQQMAPSERSESFVDPKQSAVILPPEQILAQDLDNTVIDYHSTPLHTSIFETTEDLPPLPSSRSSSPNSYDEPQEQDASSIPKINAKTDGEKKINANIRDQSIQPSQDLDHFGLAKRMYENREIEHSMQDTAPSSAQDSRPEVYGLSRELDIFDVSETDTSVKNDKEPMDAASTVDPLIGDVDNMSASKTSRTIEPLSATEQRQLQEKDAQDAVDSWFSPTPLKFSKKDKKKKKSRDVDVVEPPKISPQCNEPLLESSKDVVIDDHASDRMKKLESSTKGIPDKEFEEHASFSKPEISSSRPNQPKFPKSELLTRGMSRDETVAVMSAVAQGSTNDEASTMQDNLISPKQQNEPAGIIEAVPDVLPTDLGNRALKDFGKSALPNLLDSGSPNAKNDSESPPPLSDFPAWEDKDWKPSSKNRKKKDKGKKIEVKAGILAFAGTSNALLGQPLASAEDKRAPFILQDTDVPVQESFVQPRTESSSEPLASKEVESQELENVAPGDNEEIGDWGGTLKKKKKGKKSLKASETPSISAPVPDVENNFDEPTHEPRGEDLFSESIVGGTVNQEMTGALRDNATNIDDREGFSNREEEDGERKKGISVGDQEPISPQPLVDSTKGVPTDDFSTPPQASSQEIETILDKEDDAHGSAETPTLVEDKFLDKSGLESNNLIEIDKSAPSQDSQQMSEPREDEWPEFGKKKQKKGKKAKKLLEINATEEINQTKAVDPFRSDTTQEIIECTATQPSEDLAYTPISTPSDPITLTHHQKHDIEKGDDVVEHKRLEVETPTLSPDQELDPIIVAPADVLVSKDQQLVPSDTFESTVGNESDPLVEEIPEDDRFDLQDSERLVDKDVSIPQNDEIPDFVSGKKTKKSKRSKITSYPTIVEDPSNNPDPNSAPVDSSLTQDVDGNDFFASSTTKKGKKGKKGKKAAEPLPIASETADKNIQDVIRLAPAIESHTDETDLAVGTSNDISISQEAQDDIFAVVNTKKNKKGKKARKDSSPIPGDDGVDKNVDGIDESTTAIEVPVQDTEERIPDAASVIFTPQETPVEDDLLNLTTAKDNIEGKNGNEDIDISSPDKESVDIKEAVEEVGPKLSAAGAISVPQELQDDSFVSTSVKKNKAKNGKKDVDIPPSEDVTVKRLDSEVAPIAVDDESYFIHPESSASKDMTLTGEEDCPTFAAIPQEVPAEDDLFAFTTMKKSKKGKKGKKGADLLPISEVIAKVPDFIDVPLPAIDDKSDTVHSTSSSSKDVIVPEDSDVSTFASTRKGKKGKKGKTAQIPVIWEDETAMPGTSDPQGMLADIPGKPASETPTPDPKDALHPELAEEVKNTPESEGQEPGATIPDFRTPATLEENPHNSSIADDQFDDSLNEADKRLTESDQWQIPVAGRIEASTETDPAPLIHTPVATPPLEVLPEQQGTDNINERSPVSLHKPEVLDDVDIPASIARDDPAPKVTWEKSLQPENQAQAYHSDFHDAELPSTENIITEGHSPKEPFLDSKQLDEPSQSDKGHFDEEFLDNGKSKESPAFEDQTRPYSSYIPEIGIPSIESNVKEALDNDKLEQSPKNEVQVQSNSSEFREIETPSIESGVKEALDNDKSEKIPKFEDQTHSQFPEFPEIEIPSIESNVKEALDNRKLEQSPKIEDQVQSSSSEFREIETPSIGSGIKGALDNNKLEKRPKSEDQAQAYFPEIPEIEIPSIKSNIEEALDNRKLEQSPKIEDQVQSSSSEFHEIKIPSIERSIEEVHSSKEPFLVDRDLHESDNPGNGQQVDEVMSTNEPGESSKSEYQALPHTSDVHGTEIPSIESIMEEARSPEKELLDDKELHEYQRLYENQLIDEVLADDKLGDEMLADEKLHHEETTVRKFSVEKPPTSEELELIEKQLDGKVFADERLLTDEKLRAEEKLLAEETSLPEEKSREGEALVENLFNDNQLQEYERQYDEKLTSEVLGDEQLARILNDENLILENDAGKPDQNELSILPPTIDPPSLEAGRLATIEETADDDLASTFATKEENKKPVEKDLAADFDPLSKEIFAGQPSGESPVVGAPTSKVEQSTPVEYVPAEDLGFALTKKGKKSKKPKQKAAIMTFDTPPSNGEQHPNELPVIETLDMEAHQEPINELVDEDLDLASIKKSKKGKKSKQQNAGIGFDTPALNEESNEKQQPKELPIIETLDEEAEQEPAKALVDEDPGFAPFKKGKKTKKSKQRDLVTTFDASPSNDGERPNELPTIENPVEEVEQPAKELVDEDPGFAPFKKGKKTKKSKQRDLVTTFDVSPSNEEQRPNELPTIENLDMEAEQPAKELVDEDPGFAPFKKGKKTKKSKQRDLVTTFDAPPSNEEQRPNELPGTETLGMEAEQAPFKELVDEDPSFASIKKGKKDKKSKQRNAITAFDVPPSDEEIDEEQHPEELPVGISDVAAEQSPLVEQPADEAKRGVNATFGTSTSNDQSYEKQQSEHIPTINNLDTEAERTLPAQELVGEELDFAPIKKGKKGKKAMQRDTIMTSDTSSSNDQSLEKQQPEQLPNVGNLDMEAERPPPTVEVADEDPEFVSTKKSKKGKKAKRDKNLDFNNPSSNDLSDEKEQPEELPMIGVPDMGAEQPPPSEEFGNEDAGFTSTKKVKKGKKAKRDKSLEFINPPSNDLSNEKRQSEELPIVGGLDIKAEQSLPTEELGGDDIDFASAKKSKKAKKLNVEKTVDVDSSSQGLKEIPADMPPVDNNVANEAEHSVPSGELAGQDFDLEITKDKRVNKCEQEVPTIDFETQGLKMAETLQKPTDPVLLNEETLQTPTDPILLNEETVQNPTDPVSLNAETRQLSTDLAPQTEPTFTHMSKSRSPSPQHLPENQDVDSSSRKADNFSVHKAKDTKDLEVTAAITTTGLAVGLTAIEGLQRGMSKKDKKKAKKNAKGRKPTDLDDEENSGSATPTTQEKILVDSPLRILTPEPKSSDNQIPQFHDIPPEILGLSRTDQITTNDTEAQDKAPTMNHSNNRDSAIQVSDSPNFQVEMPPPRMIRDSGYQDAEASPLNDVSSGSMDRIGGSPAKDIVDPFSMEKENVKVAYGQTRQSLPQPEIISENPLNISVEVDPDYDVTISRPRSKRGRSRTISGHDQDHDHDSQRRSPSKGIDGLRGLDSIEGFDDPREPSPVSSTTKDRSSVLFQSSPSTREDYIDQPPKHESPLNEPVVIDGQRPDSWTLPNWTQSVDVPKPDNLATSDSHARSPPALGGKSDIDRGVRPSIFGGPINISDDLRGSSRSPFSNSSPTRQRLNTINENSPEESPSHKKSRSISDVGSPERGVKSLRRSKTPQKVSRYRSRSPSATETATQKPFTSDDFIDRLSWPPVDEDNHSVDLERSRSRNTDVHVAGRQSHVPGLARDREAERRSVSGASAGSVDSINAIIRTPDQVRTASGLSQRSSGTPPLRRSDRSISGDLRVANKKLEAKNLAKFAKTIDTNTGAETAETDNLDIDIDNRVIPSSSTYDPTKDKGKGRLRDMADVYEGWGDVRGGSPLSPTRPPSMRRRQSLQVLDLETKVDQLVSENRLLQDAKLRAERTLESAEHGRNQEHESFTDAIKTRDQYLSQKDSELNDLKLVLERLQSQVSQLTETNEELARNNQGEEHEQRYRQLETDHANTHQLWQQSTRELEGLRQQHSHLSEGMEEIVSREVNAALEEKNVELRRIHDELEVSKEEVRRLQQQILASKNSNDIIADRDEDYFDEKCQELCGHVQQWVLRFSKFSDSRACYHASEVIDERIVERFENAILDGSDVGTYLKDRVKRRDVFMSVVMTMVWEYIFTRYLFGMDRENRQKLKLLEKTLSEVGPVTAVRKWRAMTLSMLAKRKSFAAQRAQDTEAIVQEIYETLATFLPPPSHLVDQIQASLRKVMGSAVDLSIEMRTQRAEYVMLPPLQPEYDTNGDLVHKVYFNAANMNERSGTTSSNEELESQRAVVRMVLFPLVTKKGDDSGAGDEEFYICPAQVLTAPSGKEKRVRVVSAQGVRSAVSLGGASDVGMGNMI